MVVWPGGGITCLLLLMTMTPGSTSFFVPWVALCQDGR